MQASENDLRNLLELQEVDIAGINAQKKLDGLPQRNQLAELSKKKHAVLEKLAQVAKMHDAARRKVNQIDDEQIAASEKHEQVKAVKKQLEDAIATLDAQALKIRDAYQRDAVELKTAIDSSNARRDEIVERIDSTLLREYTRAAQRGGGIGMARLVEGRCSTCRSQIDDNRMLQIKAEAPLARCPHCGRLLIIG